MWFIPKKPIEKKQPKFKNVYYLVLLEDGTQYECIDSIEESNNRIMNQLVSLDWHLTVNDEYVNKKYIVKIELKKLG